MILVEGDNDILLLWPYDTMSIYVSVWEFRWMGYGSLAHNKIRDLTNT